MKMHRTPRTSELRAGWLIACAAVGWMGIALPFAATTPVLAQDAYVPAEPEPGTDIPKATVRAGFRPYADGSFPIIGIKQGFFSDVGIEISPADGLR